MSQHDPSKPTSTNIKIAAKDASQRASSGADPGPGDISAAPSEAPQLVDIPEPPTPSQLVVKSTSQGAAGSTGTKVVSSGRMSGPKSTIMASMKHSTSGRQHSEHQSGSQMGPAASNKSAQATRESTSSKPLTGPSSEAKSAGSTSGHRSSSGAGGAASGASGPKSVSDGHQVTGSPGLSVAAAGPAASETGAEHDVDEEGEGEVEQPEEGGTPSPSSPSTGPQTSAAKSASGAPEPSGSGAPGSVSPKSSASDASGTSGPSPTAVGHKSSHRFGKDKKKKKKVTRFRYHKRVTVRTTGKTSPSTIMSKVNKKDHKAGITPSTIEDMDTDELMRRAGIKGNKQTHWRVRLRQTKRLTKNGKTTTQTKVAYRDSEGNKRIKTSSSPFCKHCGKKLEECKCDSTSQS